MKHRRAVWRGLLKNAKGILTYKIYMLLKYLLLFNKAQPASLRNVIYYYPFIGKTNPPKTISPNKAKLHIPQMSPNAFSVPNCSFEQNGRVPNCTLFKSRLYIHIRIHLLNNLFIIFINSFIIRQIFTNIFITKWNNLKITPCIFIIISKNQFIFNI